MMMYSPKQEKYPLNMMLPTDPFFFFSRSVSLLLIKCASMTKWSKIYIIVRIYISECS